MHYYVYHCRETLEKQGYDCEDKKSIKKFFKSRSVKVKELKIKSVVIPKSSFKQLTQDVVLFVAGESKEEINKRIKEEMQHLKSKMNRPSNRVYAIEVAHMMMESAHMQHQSIVGSPNEDDYDMGKRCKKLYMNMYPNWKLGHLTGIVLDDYR